MKRVLLIFLVGCLLSSCQNGEASPTQPEEPMDVESEKLRLRTLKEMEWPKAYKEQDTVLLDRILGDDFQMITNEGEWSNKRKQLERIKQSAMDHDSFWYEIKRLEILENSTALLSDEITIEGTADSEFVQNYIN